MMPDGYNEIYHIRLRKIPKKTKPKECMVKTIRSCLENVSTILVAQREQSWIQYKLNDED